MAEDQMILNLQIDAAWEATRPCVIFKPRLFADGNMWCALFGENLQEGVSGFGETPAKAMTAFDLAWTTGQTPIAERLFREAGAQEPKP